MCLFRLFSVAFVLAHELIDATSGVDEFQLTGEVRMRGVRDFELDNRILIAIGEDDGLFGGSAALGEDHVLVGHIFEHNQTVIFGMDSFFHDLIFFGRFKQWFYKRFIKKIYLFQRNLRVQK